MNIHDALRVISEKLKNDMMILDLELSINHYVPIIYLEGSTVVSDETQIRWSAEAPDLETALIKFAEEVGK